MYVGVYFIHLLISPTRVSFLQHTSFTYIYIYIYVYIFVYIYVYVYICIYIYPRKPR